MNGATGRFFGWILIAVLTVVIGILVVFVTNELDYEKDLTEDQRFTLPEPAKNLAAQLQDTMKVTLYLSDPLPVGFGHVKSTLRDRLQDFREASKNKVEYEFIDPAGDPDLVAELKDRQIVPVQGRDRVEGKVTTGEYYLSAVFRYQDSEEIVNLVQIFTAQGLASQEALQAAIPYQIAARISKALHPDAKIGVLSDKKPVPQQLQQVFGQQPTAGLDDFRKQIESHYAAPLDVSIKGGIPVREDVSTLIVHRPEALSPRELYELDQFLMKGGRVLMLMDTVSSFDMDRVQPIMDGFGANNMPIRVLDLGAKDSESATIRSWLAHFGVVVEDGVVADRENVAIRRQVMKPNPPRLEIDEKVYPNFVVANQKNKEGEDTKQISQDSSVFSGIASIQMLWPAPLAIEAGWKDRNPGMKLEELVFTSKDSWVIQPEADRLPVWDMPPPEDRSTWKQRPLVVATSGRYRSFFSGKEKPARTGPDGAELPEPGGNETAKLDESSAPGQLWVIADSDFISGFWNRLLQRQFGEVVRGNAFSQLALVNALDALTLGDELIEIRQPLLVERTVNDPKKLEDDEEVSKIRFKVIWIPVIAVVGFGVLVGLFRMVSTGARSPSGGVKHPVMMEGARAASRPSRNEEVES